MFYFIFQIIIFKFFESSVDASFDGDGNYSSGSILEYCIIEYGQGVYLNYAFPFINNCTIRYNGTYPGIYGSAPSGVSGKITNNQFYNNSEGECSFNNKYESIKNDNFHIILSDDSEKWKIIERRFTQN